MLGVRIKDGEITNCGVVNGMDNETCHLSAADTKALMALPVYQAVGAPARRPGRVPHVQREPDLARTGITG